MSEDEGEKSIEDVVTALKAVGERAKALVEKKKIYDTGFVKGFAVQEVQNCYSPIYVFNTYGEAEGFVRYMGEMYLLRKALAQMEGKKEPKQTKYAHIDVKTFLKRTDENEQKLQRPDESGNPDVGMRKESDASKS